MDAKDEIKQRLDICDVIAEYITLKPAGTHAMKAVCPFHSEKTPSFHISRDKQIWRCFGCNLGGDIFSFVMQMEGVDFPEALRMLGKKAGVEVQRFDSQESNEKQRLQQLQTFAVGYYHKTLLDASYAQVARDYVAKRAIPSELVERFKLGYAPDDWDLFCKAAQQKGFTENDLVSGGLALRRKSGSGVIDRFRHRLMVPLCDIHSNVVGFTGRVLRVEDTPKYMNSPETPLYKKSQVLYGLDLGKQAIRKADRVILVEGNLDVIASHKAGVENVVAASGTALTEMQIELLKRFTKNFVFCFDADAAGFAAAERGIALAQTAGVNVSVLFIPDGQGKDPDEVVQKDPALWQKIVDNSLPLMEWYFTQVAKGRDLNVVAEKKAVGSKLLGTIARLTDLIEREYWLERLSTLLHVELSVLKQAIVKDKPATPATTKRQETPSVSSKPAEKSVIKKLTRQDRGARLLIAILIQEPTVAKAVFVGMDEALIPEGPLRTLYSQAKLLYTSHQPPDNKSYFELLASTVPPESIPLLQELALMGEQTAADNAQNNLRVQLEEAMAFLRGASKEDHRRSLLTALRDAELVGDTNRVKEILSKLDAIT